jgi:hypothetical protein
MNVTTTGAALLSYDVLQVPATVTLALPSTPVATVIATTVVIRPTLRAGTFVVVTVQNHVTGDDKGITAWTPAAVVLLMNGGPDGRARTSLILTYANDAGEVVVTLLTREYGTMVVVVRESAIAALRPPMITSVHVLAHHPSHQQLQALAKVALRASPP